MKRFLHKNIHKNLQKELSEITDLSCSLQTILATYPPNKDPDSYFQSVFEIYQNLQSGVARLEKKLLVFEENFTQNLKEVTEESSLT